MRRSTSSLRTALRRSAFMAEVVNWVRACRSPVVPGTSIHAMALTPLVLWTVWWSWWAFVLTMLSTAAFVVLEIKGRRPGWIVARLRSRLRGQFVAARPSCYIRRRSRLNTYAAVTPSKALEETQGYYLSAITSENIFTSSSLKQTVSRGLKPGRLP